MFLMHILNMELVKTRSALFLNIIASVANMGVFVKCRRGICLEISTSM